MSRPREIPVIDLMFSIPSGRQEDVMGLGMMKGPARDASTQGYTHHPAEYMYKEKPEHMGRKLEPEEIVAMLDEYGVQTVQISVNARKPEPALELFEKFPGRFIGEVFVDANRGMEAVRELERTVRLHPNIVSAFGGPCMLSPQVPINDRFWYPVYAKCIELDIPIQMLVGVPGPRVPYKCQHPGLLDEVAYFFPELRVVMRHGGDPWTDLCCKLMLKWPNLYYSTTAWAPQYYPRNVLDFANKRGRDKVMYAGYYPQLSYKRIFSEMDELPLRDETWRPFLHDNARRVFRLDHVDQAAPQT